MLVLPAYAGMIQVSEMKENLRRRAPRVCGDDPRKKDAAVARYKCSPRMRG